MSFEIVLLAMVAAFLGLRLYSVLGRRTGHEQEPLAHGAVDERPPVAVAVPSMGNKQIIPPATEESNFIESAAESGLKAIINADRYFDIHQFADGAKSAYEIILEAFWEGNKNRLNALCDDDVYDSFSGEVDARNGRGETLHNKLVRINRLRLIDASLHHPIARITVRYDSDVSTLIKDKDGNVIGGSMTDAVEVSDIWTFYRDLKSSNRNWKLDETDSV